MTVTNLQYNVRCHWRVITSINVYR